MTRWPALLVVGACAYGGGFLAIIGAPEYGLVGIMMLFVAGMLCGLLIAADDRDSGSHPEGENGEAG